MSLLTLILIILGIGFIFGIGLIPGQVAAAWIFRWILSKTTKPAIIKVIPQKPEEKKK